VRNSKAGSEGLWKSEVGNTGKQEVRNCEEQEIRDTLKADDKN
jgi:hypothetical protein